MDNLEEKLTGLLRDPEAMQKIMTMAQSLSAAVPQEASPPPQGGESPLPDPVMLQRLAGLMGQSGIDTQQKNLLHALRPYLSSQRLQKLEHAMQAAKMARLAASFLGQQGLQRNIVR